MEHVYNLNDLKNIIDMIFFSFSLFTIFVGFGGLLSNLYMYTKLIPEEIVGYTSEIKQKAILCHKREIEKNLVGVLMVLSLFLLYLFVGQDLHLPAGSLHVCQC